MLRFTFRNGMSCQKLVRFCSAEAVKAAKPVNLVGQAYQDMIHRGRGVMEE